MTEHNRTPNGWDAWGNHVLLSLERIDKNVQDLSNALQQVEIRMTDEISTLRTKAGFWGLLGGVATMLLALGVYLIAHR